MKTGYLVGFVIVASQLAACAAGRLASIESDSQIKKFAPLSDNAQIYVCRNNKFFGAAIAPTIELDNKPIGLVGTKNYVYAEVSPGEHKLVAKTLEHDSVMEFTLKPGEQKFFETWMSWGFFMGWGLIDDMADADGRECVKNGKLVEDPKHGVTVTTNAKSASSTEAVAIKGEKTEPRPAAVTTTTPPAATQISAKPAQQASQPTQSATGNPAVPAAPTYAAIDDVAAVPYLTEQGREAYREYLTKQDPKAFAIAPNGGAYSVWGKSRDLSLPADPSARVLILCERIAKRPCELYAVNSKVVWTKITAPDRTASAAQ